MFTVRVFRETDFWIVVAVATALAVGLILTARLDLFWVGLLRRLSYLPILFAGFRYGLRGGLLTAAAITVGFTLQIFAGHQPAWATTAWFEIPCFFAVGAVSGLLADQRGRTERARRQAERQQTLDELANGLAREARMPLAVVRRSARAMAANADSRTVELADTISKEASRVDRMVRELLRYTRPAGLQFGRAHLSEVFESCIEQLKPESGRRRVEFVRHWPDPEPEIYVDPDQLGRLFLNLLQNALDASPDGGRVVVRLEPAGRWLRATVRDFGSGIPEDKLSRVFEPFFTTRAQGLGLGLATARRIVRGHEGRLRLDNAEPRGIVATVELPGSIG